jgi:hypothetical protein
MFEIKSCGRFIMQYKLQAALIDFTIYIAEVLVLLEIHHINKLFAAKIKSFTTAGKRKCKCNTAIES